MRVHQGFLGFMIFQFDKLIDRERAAGIVGAIETEEFVTGDLSAGFTARQVKNNKEISLGSAVGTEYQSELSRALWKDPLFRTIAMPKRIVDCIFSRYEVGMSMTLFLDDASTYDGGELIINSETAPQAVKLDRGDAILYPTTDFHRVAPVTRGVRRVALFWIQSLVRDARQREILTEMWVALDYMYNLQPAEQAKDNKAFTTLDKARSNLLWMWAEV
jgi:PKHD-type hydroxylase